jgi:hypothetical protein
MAELREDSDFAQNELFPMGRTTNPLIPSFTSGIGSRAFGSFVGSFV